jgi:hypothetical protein
MNCHSVFFLGNTVFENDAVSVVARLREGLEFLVEDPRVSSWMGTGEMNGYSHFRDSISSNNLRAVHNIVLGSIAS